MRSILIVIFLIVLQSGVIAKEIKERDMNGDGKTDLWMQKTDDGTLEVVHDADFDGMIDYCSIRYGQKEFPAREQIDFGCDGTINLIVYYNDYKTEVDLNADGAIDFFHFLEDRVTKRIELDTNYDGSVDAIQVFKQGRFRYCEVDRDHDGKFDRTFENVELFDNWLKRNRPDFFNAVKSLSMLWGE